MLPWFYDFIKISILSCCKHWKPNWRKKKPRSCDEKLCPATPDFSLHALVWNFHRERNPIFISKYPRSMMLAYSFIKCGRKLFIVFSFWPFLSNFIIVSMPRTNEWWINMPSWIELLNASSEIWSILFQLIYLWQNATLIVSWLKMCGAYVECGMWKTVGLVRWMHMAVWHTYRQPHLHPPHGYLFRSQETKKA